MYSIKDRLVNTLTVIIGIILLVVFLSLDFILDAWVDQQFDDALVEKSNYLKSLVEVESDGIEFEYHTGFMPQFERKDNAQYFQIHLFRIYWAAFRNTCPWPLCYCNIVRGP